MGKKKQKVRWTAVEENFFAAGSNSGDDESSETGISRPSFHNNKSNNNNHHLSNGGEGFQNPRSYSPYYNKYRGEHHYREGGNYYSSSNYYQYNNGYGGHRHGRGGYHNSGDRGGGGGGWNSAPIAPRFERKARAAAAQAAAAASSSSAGEGDQTEDCMFETEHLPDGFTKIRSKNLDVLFKKEYYAHKIEMSRSNGSSDHDGGGEDEEEDGEGHENGNVDDDETKAKDKDENHSGEEEANDGTEEETDSADGDKIQESKKDKANSSSSRSSTSFTYSPNAPPFIPSSQSNAVAAMNSRPNLFLYSPSSNTMIPCEEIIIPNPVMGPDGPVYQGPSNIYLAFPSGDGSQSHDGSGSASPAIAAAAAAAAGNYMTHQILPSPHGPGATPGGAVQYDQYGVPYQSYQQQQPHHSMYQSSSDSGGTEPGSADSTTPHSPPDLSMYSPAGWADSSNNVLMHFDQRHPQQDHQQQLQPHHHHHHIINSGVEDFEEEDAEIMATPIYNHHHNLQPMHYSQQVNAMYDPATSGADVAFMDAREQHQQTSPTEMAATETAAPPSESHLSTSASIAREERSHNRFSKKKIVTGAATQQEESPMERHIPGLNLVDQQNGVKKIQKKKRKKKAAATTSNAINSAAVVVQAPFIASSPDVEDHNVVEEVTEKIQESAESGRKTVHLRDEDNESSQIQTSSEPVSATTEAQKDDGEENATDVSHTEAMQEDITNSTAATSPSINEAVKQPTNPDINLETQDCDENESSVKCDYDDEIKISDVAPENSNIPFPPSISNCGDSETNLNNNDDISTVATFSVEEPNSSSQNVCNSEPANISSAPEVMDSEGKDDCCGSKENIAQSKKAEEGTSKNTEVPASKEITEEEVHHKIEKTELFGNSSTATTTAQSTKVGVPENSNKSRQNNKRNRVKAASRRPNPAPAATATKEERPKEESVTCSDEAPASDPKEDAGLTQKLSYSKVLMAQSSPPVAPSPILANNDEKKGSIVAEDCKSAVASTHSNPSSAPSTPNRRGEGNRRKNSVKKSDFKGVGRDQQQQREKGQRKSQAAAERRNNKNKAEEDSKVIQNNNKGNNFVPPGNLEAAVVLQSSSGDSGEWETKRRRSSRKNNNQTRAMSPRNPTPSPPREQVKDIPEEKTTLEVTQRNNAEEKENQAENVNIVQDQPHCPILSGVESEAGKATLDEETATSATSAAPSLSTTSSSRPKRRKKNRGGSQENGEVSTSSFSSANKSSIRPVLIQDGVIDVAGSASGSGYKRAKRASEILDGQKLSEAVRRGHLDSLIISSVGHGISIGPMAMGRFGLGKYTPPDRTHEIPIELRTEPAAAATTSDDNQSSQQVDKLVTICTGTSPSADRSGDDLDLD